MGVRLLLASIITSFDNIFIRFIFNAGSIIFLTISGVKCAIILAPAALSAAATTIVVDAALAGGGTIILAEAGSVIGVTGVAVGGLANLYAGVTVFTTTLSGRR